MSQENNHMYSSKRGINLKKAVKYLYKGNYEINERNRYR